MWIDALERETENLAAVTRVLFERRDLETATDYWWSLYLYLWIGGYLGVVRTWGEEMLEIAEREGIALEPARAGDRASTTRTPSRFWQEPSSMSRPG